MSETIDEMMARMAGEFRRRAGMSDGRRQAKWEKYAAAAEAGFFPSAAHDPDLMPYNPEMALARAAGRTGDPDDIPEAPRPRPRRSPAPTPTPTPTPNPAHSPEAAAERAARSKAKAGAWDDFDRAIEAGDDRAIEAALARALG